ncbi:hypothetical protein [Streptomyces sp. ML-6]|uniref:hypothetical protein n=1 Tax=Streptomyces sp. ML-6 TaxID=2982693 RepID=UPI0024BF1618|nr:hypothetical protein [Streptomyces sp. ML-6]MDK0524863.1 hypothetical protein [Streptomyces sp. ML-6]
MTRDHLTAPAAALTARAEYHSDWHVYVDDPVDGPLGYCTGTGPDEDFDPAAATQALERDGWRVTGPWTATPPTDEAPFIATVERAGDRSGVS